MVWWCFGLGMKCIVHRGRKDERQKISASTQRRRGHREKTEEKIDGHENKTGRRWRRPVDDYDEEIGLAFFAARRWLLAGAAFLFYWS